MVQPTRLAKKRPTSSTSAHAADLELPVLDVWRDVVNEALQAQGRGSKRRLAEAVSKILGRRVTPGAISQVLLGNYRMSILVRPISVHLGVVVPLPVVEDEEMAAWYYAGAKLRAKSPDAFRAHLRTVEAYSAGMPTEQRHKAGK